MPPPLARVRCRQIEAGDLEPITDLLAAGFPARSRKYWTSALATLAARPPVEGCPRFGYMLEVGGAASGVVLLIASRAGGVVRCNVSSWYVAPQARAYGSLLVTQALKANPDVAAAQATLRQAKETVRAEETGGGGVSLADPAVQNALTDDSTLPAANDQDIGGE